MLWFFLIGDAPLPLLIALAFIVWLTVIELREFRPTWKWWAWWLTFVILTHFVGYLILRGYRFFSKVRHSRA